MIYKPKIGIQYTSVERIFYRKTIYKKTIQIQNSPFFVT